ncbi:MAG: MBL fold metallo-hydrolase [Bacteroidia bacterium]
MTGFEFRFVSMGMGDCTLIKCPDGKVVIVDCGTSATGKFMKWEDHFQEAQDWLGRNAKTGKIHAAVLTHSDKDHYNKLLSLLYIGKAIDDETEQLIDVYFDIAHVYFSCPRNSTEETPMASYDQLETGIAITDGIFNTKGVFLVNLNDPNGKKNTTIQYEVDEEDAMSYTETITKISGTPGKVTIASGTDTKKNYAWSLDIIAGNVGEAEKKISDTEKINANSLVVLADYAGKKTLLMGDATIHTQNYLINSGYISHLANLELMTLPHHGSKHNFCKAFYDKIKLDSLVISSGFLETMHRLPNYNGCIEHWEKKIGENKNVQQDNSYWFAVDKNDTNKQTELQKLIKKWNLLEYFYDESKPKPPNRLFLTQDDEEQACFPPDNGYSIITRKKQVDYDNFYFMKLCVTYKNILQTSQGSILIGLDHRGIEIIKYPFADEPKPKDLMDEEE